jgi:site-specific recombinase XerD
MNQLDSLLTDFQQYLKGRDTAPLTVYAYLADVRAFIAWYEQMSGESFNPMDADWHDIQDWRDALAKIQKPSSVNRRLSSLRVFYTWANKAKLISSIPTVEIKNLEQQPLAPKALTEQEVQRILLKARKEGNKRDWALLSLLAATGLRAAEASALTHADLQLNERSGWITVRSGKGRRRRKVPVNTRARKVLEEYIKEIGEQPKTAPLFSTRLGTAMTPYAIWCVVKKYAALAKVENVSPHSFRHTVATRMVRNPEIDLVTAATYLGHARLDTTARYAQPNEEDLEKAAESL